MFPFTGKFTPKSYIHGKQKNFYFSRSQNIYQKNIDFLIENEVTYFSVFLFYCNSCN